jgi:3-hydroxyisobutyrate dehydrogenase
MHKMSVAFLGIGLMGEPMAKRLLDRGYLKAVWNRTREKAERLAAAGAVVATSASQATCGVDTVCLCLTDSHAVEEVIFGPHGVISRLAGQSPPLIIDFSTSSPDTSRSLAHRYRQAVGGSWLDAPVSGGVARAGAGTLIAYCGGETAHFDNALPILGALASRVTLLGPVGSGQAAKLVAQLIAAPTLVALAEALATAEAMGLEASQLIDAYKDSLVDSPLLQIFGRRMAARQVEPRIGAIGTMLKDIDNALGMARAAGASAPIGAEAARVFRLVCAAGKESKDLTALIEYFTQERSRKS